MSMKHRFVQGWLPGIDGVGVQGIPPKVQRCKKTRQQKRAELSRIVDALRRSKREMGVRAYALLLLLSGVGLSTLALERRLGKAGTRRVLHEVVRARCVELRNDVWCLTEYGESVLNRFEDSVYGKRGGK